MSLKTFLFSTLLATSAVATFSGTSASSYGGGSGSSSWSGGSGMSGSWGAVASCPAGCQPIQTGTPPMAGGNGELIVQVVSVSDANGSLKYFPNNIEAPIGSIVQFQFHPKNHTVSESSFAEPCKPLASNLTSATHPGLHSGFVPLKGNETLTPVYNVLVNDTKPIWVYCGQTNHCQKGMAMVINQNSSSPNTIDKYIQNAMALALTPTAAAPPAATSSVFVPPPAATATVANTFTFGGSPPAASTETPVASAAAPPPVESIAVPPSSSVAVAPATFTGAAVKAREASAGLLVLGALVAAW
ncbi:hypothetical protein LTS15_011064 [Exophiala xenobiotica]|nr:hypothetical protein LTS15_011064 [Exophiala xenobiotica]